MLSDAVINSLIAGITAVTGSVFIYLGIRARVRGAANRPLVDDEEQRDAEERYASDPTRFVKDLLESNKQYASEVREFREEVVQLRRKVTEMEVRERKRLAALGRWLMDIANEFIRVGGEMPYPREADRAILEDIIPFALEATQPRIRRQAREREDRRQNGGRDSLS